MNSVAKVSYCITCKNRTYQLKETLPANLRNEQGNENIEFVVLNYDSNDDLADWIRDNFAAEIASGRVVHAHHTPAPNFRMAHAKNIAHRAASGDILCNVDADNIIAPDFSTWLRARFSEDPNSVYSARELSFSGFIRQRWLNKYLGRPRPVDGLCGRIAVSRENFYKVGGYEEKFSAWGSDDIDFMLRARDLGLHAKYLPPSLWGEVLKHGNDERLANLSSEDKVKSQARLTESSYAQILMRFRQLLDRSRKPANPGGAYGCGNVVYNFTGPSVDFAPVVAAQPAT